MRNSDDPYSYGFYAAAPFGAPYVADDSPAPDLVTLNPNVRLPQIYWTYDINTIYDAISNGFLDHIDFRSATQQILSAAPDKVLQDTLKCQLLPVVTFSGRFEPRSAAYCKSYSRRIAIDFDYVSDVETAFTSICSYPFVEFAFRTPKGQGVKAIVLHDNANPAFHHELYKQVSGAFGPHFSSFIDPNPKDVARATFLRHDPKAWRSANPVPYHFIPSSNTAAATNTTPSIATKPCNINGIGALREALAKIPLPACKKSNQSIISSIDGFEKRQHPERFKEGHRAVSVYREACQFCRLGVDFDMALRFLRASFVAAGLGEDEISRQVFRAYCDNLQQYGARRASWK